VSAGGWPGTSGRGGRRAGLSLRSRRVPPAVLRVGARQIGRRCLDPALSWDVQRRRLDQLTGVAILPRGTVVTDEIIGGVRADVVTVGRKDSPGSGPTVIHFHGGGYCIGSTRTPRAWAAYLSAAAGCRVILPDYRLAPEHPHPAALEDARAVFRALTAEEKAGSVVLSGDSAGGGLALALLQSIRDEGSDRPAGCILLSPWLDLARDWREAPELVRRDVLLTPDWLDACARAYAGGAGRTDPVVSPLHAGPGGLPPLLVQAGTDELLAPDAEQLAASASGAGVDVTFTKWPRMWHDFALQPGLLAAADSAVAQAAWFVGRVRAE
jgi:epsilon-lactone hydrolase